MVHGGWVLLQVLSGGHGARTYQDERFSYVVMRRGPRPGPETVPDLTVARQRQVDAPDAVQRAIDAGEGLTAPFSTQIQTQHRLSMLYIAGRAGFKNKDVVFSLFSQ